MNGADYLLDGADNELTQVENNESTENYIEPEQSEFVDPTDTVEENNNNNDIILDNPIDPALAAFMKSYGIEDPTKLKFTDDDGNVEEVDFRDLSDEEKTTVLSELASSNVNNDLSEAEQQAVAYMRENGMSLGEIMEAYAKQKIEEARQQEMQARPYSIDDYTDEQLYVGDLKTRYPDMTDEELIAELTTAQENPDLFTRKVAALRSEYKALEDNERAQQEAQSQQEYVDLRNNLAGAIDSFSEFTLDPEDPESDTLLLEDTDKQQMLSYLLEQDASGKSALIRELEDPKKLAEIALMRVKGAEFLASTTRYYKNELSKAHAEIKKLQAKVGKPSTSKSTVVSKTTVQPKNDTAIKVGYFDHLI